MLALSDTCQCRGLIGQSVDVTRSKAHDSSGERNASRGKRRRRAVILSVLAPAMYIKELHPMLQRLRQRASDERGFTLIELLVVILIIGILAAIAIPAFLNQTQKANDSSAKSLARNAATFAQTYATENSGSFKGLSAAEITKLEKGLEVCGEGGATKNACLKEVKAVGAKEEGFKVVAEAPTTKNTYTFERTEEGTTVRSCATKGTGGCPSSGEW